MESEGVSVSQSLPRAGPRRLPIQLRDILTSLLEELSFTFPSNDLWLDTNPEPDLVVTGPQAPVSAVKESLGPQRSSCLLEAVASHTHTQTHSGLHDHERNVSRLGDMSNHHHQHDHGLLTISS